MKVKEIVEFLKEQDPYGEGELVIGTVKRDGDYLLPIAHKIDVVRNGMPVRIHKKHPVLHQSWPGKYFLCITRRRLQYSPCKEPKDD